MQHDKLIGSFIEGWVSELTRAIEMFSGEEPRVTFAPVDTPAVAGAGTALWVRQIFESADSFQTWIGAEEPTWTHLGQMLGTGNVETIRSTYIEIVNQAQQGSATLINVGRSLPVRCHELEQDVQTNFDLAQLTCWEISFDGIEIPPLSFVLERKAAEVLSLNALDDAAQTDSDQRETKQSQNMEAFCNLMLPVSVSMAEAELELKHILKAGVKSVISVNKNHEDSVDLLVYNTVVARGNVVIVDGNYGFQIQQIVSEEERLTLLR